MSSLIECNSNNMINISLKEYLEFLAMGVGLLMILFLGYFVLMQLRNVSGTIKRIIKNKDEQDIPLPKRYGGS